MTTYWFLYFMPLFAGILDRGIAQDLRRLVWIFIGTFIAIVIGFRDQIGADWGIYLSIQENIQSEGLSYISGQIDIGYGAISWLSAHLGWGIYGVNLVCGIIFVAGLGAFCRRQPIPWLAWLIATPYLLIVVAMGYTRQGAALGFVFWGLAVLEDKRVWRYLLLVCLGATFHRSAVVMLPMVFLLQEQTKWAKLFGMFLVIATASAILMLEHYQILWTSYVSDPDQLLVSEGAMTRAWMNAVPSALYLLMSRYWTRQWPDPGHWRWIAWLSIGSVFLVDFATTAVDRTVLYLSPIQLYVGTHLPMVFTDRLTRLGVVLAVCVLYAAVLWVWFTFGNFSWAWLPYQNILFPW